MWFEVCVGGGLGACVLNLWSIADILTLNPADETFTCNVVGRESGAVKCVFVYVRASLRGSVCAAPVLYVRAFNAHHQLQSTEVWNR